MTDARTWRALPKVEDRDGTVSTTGFRLSRHPSRAPVCPMADQLGGGRCRGVGGVIIAAVVAGRLSLSSFIRRRPRWEVAPLERAMRP